MKNLLYLIRASSAQSFFALALLLLVGLHPFTYTSLAASFDGLLHLHRLVELDHLIKQGVFFPRWAPDFVFGFGYPIFNFYAPLSYYLSAPLHWLGFSFADTATLFFVLCTLGAGISMYLFTRDSFDDSHAAICAAVAYAYAPTHIYDNFYRSAWGTVLAYLIVPVALWAIERWYCTGRARFLAALTFSVAGLLLAHNVSALLAMPVIVGAAAVFLRAGETAPTRLAALRRLLAAGVTIAFGFALSAFFWLPAIAETPYIQTWRLTIPPDFDFHTHFLSPFDWITLPFPAEVGRINPDLVNTAGPIHVLLAVGGIVAVVGVALARRFTYRSAYVAFFALCLTVSLYMTLPQSAWLWERVALLPSLQFPHRFLTISALCIAVLSGAFIAAIPTRWRGYTGAIACTLLIIFGMPFLYPRPHPPINPNPSPADVLAHEHKTGALGTTASGEYFPTWVQFIPRTSSLEEAIAKGENPQRFEPRSLPAGAGILSEQTSPLSFSLHITSPKSFRATFLHFYFPGWQGYVDGQPVPTTPSAGQGFSTFEVPEGEHQISLKFDSTPIRDNAILISLCSMVIGSLLLIVHQVQLSGNTRLIVQTNLDQLQPVGHGQAPVWAYGVLGIVLLLFKVGIVDRVDTPLRVTFDGVRVHTVQYARSVGFSRVLTWLGYDLSAESVFPGQVFNLTLYWQAQRELDTVYSSFAHLIDERANLYAQKDNLHPGNTPTTTWRRREFNVDRHPIEVPAGTPPGDYWIEIGMYDPRTGARLLRESTSENQPPDRILIGPVRVLKSAQPPSVPALGIKQPLDKRWANGLSLLGFSLERDRLPADDFLRVALFWRADSAPLSDLSMTLRLLDAQGQAVTVQSSAPSNNRYPTNRWSAGETVRDNRSLWIPRALPNGVYRLQLRLDGNESWIDLTAARKQ